MKGQILISLFTLPPYEEADVESKPLTFEVDFWAIRVDFRLSIMSKTIKIRKISQGCWFRKTKISKEYFFIKYVFTIAMIHSTIYQVWTIT